METKNDKPTDMFYTLAEIICHSFAVRKVNIEGVQSIYHSVINTSCGDQKTGS
jgi:hypothetical protein